MARSRGRSYGLGNSDSVPLRGSRSVSVLKSLAADGGAGCFEPACGSRSHCSRSSNRRPPSLSPDCPAFRCLWHCRSVQRQSLRMPPCGAGRPPARRPRCGQTRLPWEPRKNLESACTRSLNKWFYSVAHALTGVAPCARLAPIMHYSTMRRWRSSLAPVDKPARPTPC